MLGMNRLGTQGRLGNQMFQYAALRGIAARHGYAFCVPPSASRDERAQHQLFRAFRLPHLKHVAVVPGPCLLERQFHFDAELVKSCPGDANLCGYFQSEKYFAHIAASLREDFRFKPEAVEGCASLLARLPDRKIALQVRRGDYVVNYLNHPPCPLEYYAKALARLDADVPVLVFSDDLRWVRRQRLFSWKGSATCRAST
jgi:hypothetical protein